MEIHTKDRKFFAGVMLISFLLGIVLTSAWYSFAHSADLHHGYSSGSSHDMMSIDEEGLMYHEVKDSLTSRMLLSGEYACCLEKPCATCLTLTPWHGEGYSCTCLDDVVNGRAPCDECVGGILSGRGNRFLKAYFVQSLSDRLGSEHTPMLDTYIAEVYKQQDKQEKGHL